MFTTFCNALILTSLFLEIYRQNLQQSMKDGELSDAEVKSLERLQVMLCIPKQTIEKIHEEICGTLFEKAIAAGVDGYDADVKQAVRKAAYGLRITREVAMSIAGKAVSVFYGFALVYFSFSLEKVGGHGFALVQVNGQGYMFNQSKYFHRPIFYLFILRAT
uniref:Uncharacterized protein n=1 Tax=Lactuca sativa TaxID=4236 RepID=A0A9R1XEF0_LACSA|nr:hypothetical protein LSAT_V11C500233540 [Lactuca sativa]